MTRPDRDMVGLADPWTGEEMRVTREGRSERRQQLHRAGLVLALVTISVVVGFVLGASW